MMMNSTQSCLNCKHKINGHYCANCGQKFTEHENLSLKHFLQTAINEVFDWDSKLWTTLKLLILRPGHLSQSYLDGQRVAYIHPVRLYIVISALFILISSGNVLRSEYQLNNIEKSAHELSLSKVKSEVRRENPKLDEPQIEKLASEQLIDSNSVIKSYLVTARNFLDGRYEVFDNHLTTNFRLLSPLSALVFAAVLSLLFRKNRFYYVQHLTFAIHYFCFSFLVSIVIGVLHQFFTSANLQSYLGLILLIQIGIMTRYFHRASQHVYVSNGKASLIKTIFALSFVFIFNLVIVLGSVSIAVTQMPLR